MNAQQKNRYAQRYRVLSHYSDGREPRCSCCSESRFEFLAIDHVDGGGNEHRRSDKTTSRMFQWLSKNGLPEGYRVLCHNCNMSHGFYGYCPHQEGEKLVEVVRHHEANRRVLAGEGHGCAVLKEQDVRDIRASLAAGETVRSLAAEYSVSPATIGHISTRKTWKHVV